MNDIPAIVMQIDSHGAHVRQNEYEGVARAEEILRHGHPPFGVVTGQHFNDSTRSMPYVPLELLTCFRTPQGLDIAIPAPQESADSSVLLQGIRYRLREPHGRSGTHVEVRYLARQSIETAVKRNLREDISYTLVTEDKPEQGACALVVNWRRKHPAREFFASE
jgi:hypothetical protein